MYSVAGIVKTQEDSSRARILVAAIRQAAYRAGADNFRNVKVLAFRGVT